MNRCTVTFAVLVILACGPRPSSDEPAPGPAPDPGVKAKPHIEVLPLDSYSWLQTANILIAPQGQKAAMEAQMVDFYSGLPMFLKVVGMFTRDRNVGLKDNPAYLTDIWTGYLDLVGATESAPPTTLDELDASSVQYAIFLAWKKANEHSGVDNYDDAVKSVDYGK